MVNHITLFRCTIIISLLFVIVACQTAEEPPLPTIVAVEEATETPAATEIPATSTPEPDPTMTATSSPVPPTEPAEIEPTPAADNESPDPEFDESAEPAPNDDEATEPPTEAPTEALPTEESATATIEPATPVSLDSLALELELVAEGFTKPLYVNQADDQTGRLFIVEQEGRIWIVKDGVVNPTPFMDIVNLVTSQGSEQGLLSVAFHPNYAENGRFFVNYTNQGGNTVIARYQVSDDPEVANLESAKILLTIPQPYANHNGGHILFGPDGYLYVGMGDGGAANDPHNNGQSLSTLLGKILRLDVDRGDPYGVPQDNPFVGQENSRPEIWSYGWRNPWRLAFDAATGDMYIADVGQNQYEEVHVELAGTPSGVNYGWRLMEGSHCFNPTDCDPEALNVALPVTEYNHTVGCSITGGYVYRGSQFPAFEGVYFYGDYCTGVIWGLRREADGSWSEAELLSSGLGISSFGQDATGEVYLTSHHTGEIFRLVNP